MHVLYLYQCLQHSATNRYFVNYISTTLLIYLHYGSNSINFAKVHCFAFPIFQLW